MGEPTQSTVNWSMICHLAGLSLYIGIPLGNVLVPLLIWLLKRKSDPVLQEQGKEAVNFNLSVTVYALVAGLLCYILIGFVLLPLVLIGHILLVIRAGLRANKGESVRYPLTLRFIN